MENSSVKEIVEWIIAEGRKKASSGVAIIREIEIIKKFGVECGWLENSGVEIYHECDLHGEVDDSLIYTDNAMNEWAIEISFRVNADQKQREA